MNRVAIVGSHTSGQETAPWDRQDTDIWVFNGAPSKPDTWVKRLSALFQMHQPDVYRSANNREDPYYWTWLQRPHEYPIYMLDTDPLVPASVRYQLDDICRDLLPRFMIDGTAKRYFASSIDYALALAIHCHYDNIEIHGVKMRSNTEYGYQRTGLTFWTGVALGRGIAVNHVGGAEIYDLPLYGYEDNLLVDTGVLTARVDELKRILKDAQRNRRQAEARMMTVWRNGAELPAAIAACSEAWRSVGFIRAALDQVVDFITQADNAKRAALVCFADRNMHEERAATAQQKSAQLDGMVKQSAGAMWSLAERALKNPRDAEAQRTMQEAVYRHLKYAEQFGKVGGVYSENLLAMARIDKGITAAGGQTALEMAKG